MNQDDFHNELKSNKNDHDNLENFGHEFHKDLSGNFHIHSTFPEDAFPTTAVHSIYALIIVP